MLDPLPHTFAASREALRSLACYVLAPARKARTGRIGLRPTPGGFGTPRFDDGSRVVVRDDRLVWEPGPSRPITTLRAAGEFVGVEVVPDPGVGHDLPPFEPDAALDVDPSTTSALSAWYELGGRVLDAVAKQLPPGSVSEAQLWPEHFDLAITVDVGDSGPVNVGFSPGDAFRDEPYLYVGPHDTTSLHDAYWNAPFGGAFGHAVLLDGGDPFGAAMAFIERGLSLVGVASP